MITLLQLQRGATIIGVRFTQIGRDGARYPSKMYHFKCCFVGVKPGDLVVVERSDGFSVGTVDKINEDYTQLDHPLGALRHVVDVVDLARHASLKIEERHLADVVMKAELESRLATLASSPVFQALISHATPALRSVSEAGTPYNTVTGEVVE